MGILARPTVSPKYKPWLDQTRPYIFPNRAKTCTITYNNDDDSDDNEDNYSKDELDLINLIRKIEPSNIRQRSRISQTASVSEQPLTQQNWSMHDSAKTKLLFGE